MSGHFHGGGCGHPPVGDPGGENRLRQACDALSAELRNAAGPDELPAEALAAARAEVAALADDLSPRTRAQARGLAAVLALLERGEREAAQGLLDGELSRSFSGRADFSKAVARA